MSTQARTDSVSPHELARKQGRFTGAIPISAFARLAPLVRSGGTVQIELEFARDERNRCRVRGSVRTTLALECQRCLEPVERDFDIAIDLCVVGSDAQARELDVAVEPFVLSDDEVPIVDLVEDDLLLALPSQICLAFDDCPNRPALEYSDAARSRTSDAQREAEAAPEHPFGALTELKNRSN